MKYSPGSNSGYPISAMIFLFFCGTVRGDTVTVPPVDPPILTKEISPPATLPLMRAGNDVFGAIQEVLHKLEADPATDWKKVNLEALRQHLLDMRHFTEDVDIVTQKSIDKGIEITVHATVPGAIPGLDRAFNAHPKLLKSETGWDMTVTKDKDKYKLHVTTSDPAQVDKLRGLGYIGIMAMGNHHPLHHWALAKEHPLH